MTLGEVVVTATRVEQSLANVLADVTVIEAEAIARSGAVSLADVLVHVPGIEMVRNGGPLGTTSLYLRGGNTNHTVVLIDGIRLDTQNGSGGATCQSIPCRFQALVYSLFAVLRLSWVLQIARAGSATALLVFFQ